MFYLLAIITGIWAMARIATHDYRQVLYLLAATVVFGVIGYFSERHDDAA